MASRFLKHAIVLATGFSVVVCYGKDPEGESEDGEGNSRIIERGVGIPGVESKAGIDAIWKLPRLYHNEDAPWIQEFSLIGRYHGQLWGVASSQGSAHEWEDRRYWGGARLRFLDEFALAAIFELDSTEDASVAEYLDTLTLAWHRKDDFQVQLGQQKPSFTYEYELSSNKILTLERSLLVNQVAPEKAPGLMFEQKLDNFHYRIAGYSGQPFDESPSDPFGIVALEYDFSEMSKRDQMAMQFYYLYNSEEVSDRARPYKHSFSLSADYEDGPNAFLGQLIYADGFESRPDVWGLTLMQARFLYGKRLQLVARYQLANSEGMDGLQVQSRYESKVPGLTDKGRGDRYHAGYLGLNWYLYGNRLKFMTGIEYSDMRGGSNGGDFSGWTGMGGVRLYF